MSSAYPLPADELIERVRALAVELGEWPSQRRVMRECRVGAPRADAALAALREEGFTPSPPRVLSVVPDSDETHAERTEQPPRALRPAHVTTPQRPPQAALRRPATAWSPAPQVHRPPRGRGVSRDGHC